MFLHLLNITIQDGTEGHIRHIGKKNKTEMEYTFLTKCIHIFNSKKVLFVVWVQMCCRFKNHFSYTTSTQGNQIKITTGDFMKKVLLATWALRDR